MDSVPFVMKFVQKAVRLLWSGLDRVVDPHESVGRELWKGVGPADLGEMAADVEMQKAFVGKKRPRDFSFQGDNERNHHNRGSSLYTQMNYNSNLPPSPYLSQLPTPGVQSYILEEPGSAPPPNRGMAPAPLLPRIVQECPPNALQFIYFDSATDGRWAVQQAVQSIRDIQLWNGMQIHDNRGSLPPENEFIHDMSVQQQQQQQQTIEQQLQHQQALEQQRNKIPPPPPTPTQQIHLTPQLQPPQIQMSFVNYDNDITHHQQEPSHVSDAYPQAEVHTDDPALIIANLVEFNTMAQMHIFHNMSDSLSTPGPSPNYNDGMVAPLNFDSNLNGIYRNSRGLSNMNHSIPHSSHGTYNSVDESTILSDSHQSMYCTNMAQPVSVQSIDHNLFANEKKVSSLLFDTNVNICEEKS